MFAFYVYAHIRPDTNQIFYIGKGKNNRAYSKDKRNIIWNRIVSKNNNLFHINILFSNLSETEALRIEINLIKQYGRLDLNTGSLANLTDGGEGTSGYICTEEHKSKISKAFTGDKHPLYGKPCSAARKKKISLTNKGRKSWNEGKHLSNETKEKISQKALGRISPHKGKKQSVEIIERRILRQTGIGNWQTRPIINFLTNEIVVYGAIALHIKLVSEGFNKALPTIRGYLNGNRKKPIWFVYAYK